MRNVGSDQDQQFSEMKNRLGPGPTKFENLEPDQSEEKIENLGPSLISRFPDHQRRGSLTTASPPYSQR